jgi:hypothetical protein
MKMIHMERQSRLAPEEVLGRLRKFFGKGGQGLELTEESASCLTFTGGGGYVTASVCLEGEQTKVDLVSQEWEYQVKEFLAKL